MLLAAAAHAAQAGPSAEARGAAAAAVAGLWAEELGYTERLLRDDVRNNSGARCWGWVCRQQDVGDAVCRRRRLLQGCLRRTALQLLACCAPT